MALLTVIRIFVFSILFNIFLPSGDVYSDITIKMALLTVIRIFVLAILFNIFLPSGDVYSHVHKLNYLYPVSCKYVSNVINTMRPIDTYTHSIVL